ncbi:response regulator [Shinella yambaruensis]|uniref:Two-component response regulator n=1 Tax=Shinella yambaruensis TaxID=415996 RepID=A0ABQ5ZBI0_9HYPH|nr:response regulator [Shinella yambaruensis]MCJ8029723.1 response regulator [Shinella yambaruensis]MCU7984051.1 response regulator [Shinella yambaruensis]GLR50173.1 two-component response regulator [Shinella yambaruensis]
MPISDRIGPHLPALRRYARALTGTQPSGDAYVAATLETILIDPSVMPEGEDDKAKLFGLLSRIISSLPVSVSRSTVAITPGTEAPFDLSGVPPLGRQALLLATVEGFTVEKTAEILDADVGAIRALLNAAFAEIAAQAETGIMIIEDEPLIALDLAHMVNGMGHRVTGIARTQAEAEMLWSDSRPGLVLADVKLADGSSGIDAVNSILARTDIPVIFITAYPERLLTGERPEPAFLVSKPFNPEQVKVLINQALLFTPQARAAA